MRERSERLTWHKEPGQIAIKLGDVTMGFFVITYWDDPKVHDTLDEICLFAAFSSALVFSSILFDCSSWSRRRLNS